jgi:electron transport complex protein RnfG
MTDKDRTETSNESRSGGTTQIYGVVLGVGVLCSLAIVSVYEVTRPIIQQNRIAFRTQAILTVLPDAKSVAAFQQSDSSGDFQPADTVTEGGDFVFAGFSEQGELVGVAIQTSGMGYQDLIDVIYGYSFADQAIIGMQVLQSRETPGLGDRIETDAGFTSNFDRLDVSLNPDKPELAHRIEFVKPLEKSDPWQIDGITGATISSRAIADMLRDSTVRWIPLVHRQRSQFVRPSPQE